MATLFDNSRAMGYENPIQGLAPQPVISKRNPTGNDKGQTGQLWVNTIANSAWINAGLVGGQTVWNQLIAPAGTGTFTAVVSTVGPNDLAGVTTLDNGLVVTAGGATINAGGLTVSGGNVTLTGNVAAATGELIAGADTGGFAGKTTIGNGTSAPVTAAVNTLVGVAGGQTNAGYLKFYLGVTAVYVPYFTAP